ncbi:hypothetical protein PR003_g19623 [Phytophthora rubi]|uniref:Uncharacterized protein n=1 Tax=Phytophthora rubi TaxID=129364 RepID=A0A6A4DRF0_9STRA|nr:hypothetical protein PR001_g19224 [Phytophthora rubi]KAE9312971.1 hypothetical protein PR003_g19623 [Phytophthora rubi]
MDSLWCLYTFFMTPLWILHAPLWIIHAAGGAFTVSARGLPAEVRPHGTPTSANRMGCTPQGRSHVAAPAGSRFHRFHHLPPPDAADDAALDQVWTT